MRRDDEMYQQAQRDWQNNADSPAHRYLQLRLENQAEALRLIRKFLSQPGRVNAATKKVCISLAGFALNGATRVALDEGQE